MCREGSVSAEHSSETLYQALKLKEGKLFWDREKIGYIQSFPLQGANETQEVS